MIHGNYDYVLSPNCTTIMAYNVSTKKNEGSIDLLNGCYIGKSGKEIKKATMFTKSIGPLIMRCSSNPTDYFTGFLISFFIEYTGCFKDFLKSNPNYFDFIKSCITFGIGSSGLDTHSLYQQKVEASATAVEITKEDADFINFLVASGISGHNICAYYNQLKRQNENIYSLAEHPNLMRVFISKLTSGQYNSRSPLGETCSKLGPSFDWYHAIIQAIINDGLDDGYKVAEIAQGIQTGLAPKIQLEPFQWIQCIDDYYAKLTVLNEYLEEPITFGFFQDYIRVCQMVKSLNEAQMQQWLDDKMVNPIEITLGDYRYVPVNTLHDVNLLATCDAYYYNDFKAILSSKTDCCIIKYRTSNDKTPVDWFSIDSHGAVRNLTYNGDAQKEYASWFQKTYCV